MESCMKYSTARRCAVAHIAANHQFVCVSVYYKSKSMIGCDDWLQWATALVLFGTYVCKSALIGFTPAHSFRNMIRTDNMF
ncbi:hypothetical protein XELAEV_18014690mg [Xenopus laevis]|uniref:Uncharacterized protein n=1 Tax=Xenopus laevis TaxID=8355 RepID=A0A974DGI9_XENLA|nr:hypothetical protein XELAEV_18014690mg [Xenopus laevis]